MAVVDGVSTSLDVPVNKEECGTVSPAELVVAKPAGPSVKTVVWSGLTGSAVVVGVSVAVAVDPIALDVELEELASDVD